MKGQRPRPTEADERVRQAELFTQTREALDLNPEELALILGTHLRTIFRWERNERAIPPYLWLALALMLDRETARRRATKALRNIVAALRHIPLPEAARAWRYDGRVSAASPVGEQ
jgi:DNA-binding XRE family transcriptional regulator